MKTNNKLLIVVLLIIGLPIFFSLFYFSYLKPEYLMRKWEPQTGDIIFQHILNSRFSSLIKGVTGSEVTHCGIILNNKRKIMVLEAIGPVKETPIHEWIKRGDKQRYLVCRFKQPYHKYIPQFIDSAFLDKGKPYDSRYDFTNNAIYCSELVFSAFYKVTNENLGQLTKLKELNWKPYENEIKKLEGGSLPLEREIITPINLSKANQLEIIFKNGL